MIKRRITLVVLLAFMLQCIPGTVLAADGGIKGLLQKGSSYLSSQFNKIKSLSTGNSNAFQNVAKAGFGLNSGIFGKNPNKGHITRTVSPNGTQNIIIRNPNDDRKDAWSKTFSSPFTMHFESGKLGSYMVDFTKLNSVANNILKKTGKDVRKTKSLITVR